jgi:DNA-binding XRE family transcriptional regulator
MNERKRKNPRHNAEGRQGAPRAARARVAAESAERAATTIRARRAALRLTQAQVAEATGADPMTISRVESGQRDVYFGTLALVASGVGLRVELVPENEAA